MFEEAKKKRRRKKLVNKAKSIGATEDDRKIADLAIINQASL